MVKKRQTKRQRDIKTKLMAAICMLLVSSIMMVSTTYAWFTLSTAPEVTGINTAVGANGNLEMALQPLNGDSSTIISSVGDSTADVFLKNTTWGNLVDVSNNTYYGLDKIMLYPAKLNTETNANGEATIKENPLQTPAYGADGRISSLESKTITGVYGVDGKFQESWTGTLNGQPTTVEGARGVRAIGISSGMSDRQLAFRAASQAANAAAAKAKNTATQSLNAHGAKLADIAVKHATWSEGEELYTAEELKPLLTILNTLLGYDTVSGENTVHTDGSLEYIGDALINYALTVALNNASDDDYANVQAAFEAATLDTLATVMANYNLNLPEVSNHIATLQTVISNVSAARAVIEPLANGNRTDIPWDEFSDELSKLANPNSMQINGIAVSELRQNWKYKDGDVLPQGYYVADGSAEKPGEVGYVYDDEKAIVSNMARLVDAVLGDGLQLIIASGAGVYADIADYCGDYSAAVTLSKVSYGGMTVKNLDATMSTKTSVTTPYLTAAKNAIPTFSAGAGGASTAINDFYGYILDLAFRTNAAGSNLLLQGEEKDRIYSDSSNEATMGHGATMTFTSSDAEHFTVNQVKSLMNCIRIVFFNTDNRVILGYARLDMANATLNNETGEIKATIIMTNADGEALDSQVIMALEQNTIHELSVMVYLDGETITNADVATGVSSMTGTMNLQFSSDANLDPMDYTPLKEGTGETPATPTVETLTVTSITDGYTATAQYGTFSGQSGVVAVISTEAGAAVTTGTVTINGVNATYNETAGGWIAVIGTKPADATIVYTAP